MISNSATFFVTGQDKKEFTYKPGKYLYHFSPYDNNISIYMDHNIVLFADNEKHGIKILIDMYAFAIQCKIEYIKDKNPSASLSYLYKTAVKDKSTYVKYLNALKEGKVKLTRAPMNQVFKVSWASNDNL